MGAHVGPIFEVFDPVRDGPGFTGTHITRAARIEPTTPEGSVYVTDAFAALVALANDPRLRCDYVGHTAMAKDYGTIPMYSLARVSR